MALTRTRTCFGPGEGSGTSSIFITSGPPNSWTRIAFMGKSYWKVAEDAGFTAETRRALRRAEVLSAHIQADVRANSAYPRETQSIFPWCWRGGDLARKDAWSFRRT